MPVEQMNVSLSPQMARFIRAKVKNGEYTNASEVVRDAVRRMQDAEVTRRERGVTEFESGLTLSQRRGIRRGIEEGIRDIDAGRFQEYDADGLRQLGKELAGASTKKLVGRRKGR